MWIEWERVANNKLKAVAPRKELIGYILISFNKFNEAQYCLFVTRFGIKYGEPQYFDRLNKAKEEFINVVKNADLKYKWSDQDSFSYCHVSDKYTCYIKCCFTKDGRTQLRYSVDKSGGTPVAVKYYDNTFTREELKYKFEQWHIRQISKEINKKFE